MNKTVWKDEELEFLKKNYLVHGAEFCARHLDRTTSSVHHKTERMLLLKPKRYIDIGKFNSIRDPAIAYFLGLLWADGGIGKYDTYLTLVESDMIEVQNILKNCGEWSFYKRIPPKNTKWKPVLIARTCNKNLRKFLEHNDYRLKSKTSPSKILSHIPFTLKPYFWRGFLDGDGCVYVQKHKQWKFGTITFAGAYEQEWHDIEKLLDTLEIRYKLSKIINKKGHRCSKLIISNLKDISSFGNYIFKMRNEDKIGLTRKYNKFKILQSYFMASQMANKTR